MGFHNKTNTFIFTYCAEEANDYGAYLRSSSIRG